MKSTNCITRNQLKGYGASSYHARIITKNLQPISKLDRANIYSLQEKPVIFENTVHAQKC